MSFWILYDSLSFWERAGVRGETRADGVLVLLLSALTLTLSHRERELHLQTK